VLAIVVIPGATLLVVGATATSLFMSEAISARNWAGYLGEEVDPVVGILTAVQNERSLSVRTLGGDRDAAANLAARRAETSAGLEALNAIFPVAQRLNPDATTKSAVVYGDLVGRLPMIRQAIDLRQTTVADVDDFYTALGSVFGLGLTGSVRTTPDPKTVAEETTVLGLLQAADVHSRAIGRAAASLASGGGSLGAADRDFVGRLVGAYRYQLDASATSLDGGVLARYQTLVGSAEWRQAIGGQKELTERGTLSVPVAGWLAAEEKVGAELRDLWSAQFRHAESVAKDAADRMLLQASLFGAAVLVFAVGAFLLAVRLANALVRRLQSLRTKTLDLADRQLPSLVRRLHDGEQIDVDAEMTVVDNGTDEIGQVAEAFTIAQRTAVAAAAAESRTREGVNKVFLDIAHRSQIVVHQQLEVLDIAEAKQGDPEHLELLFRLDHLTTRARRNAENLLVLGGGQAGRKWRNPVSLEEVVRGAVSETKDLARVSAVRLPDVRVLGAVVADLTHLLAELVDNATSFSPPDAPAAVRGNRVGRGVVVEIEDQGLGIRFEERERHNRLLHDPPDFQEMALSGQRRLGLFVVGQLAARHGITVSLQESVYGGITAIVLIPTKVLEPDAGVDNSPMHDGTPAGPRAVSRHRRPGFAPTAAIDPVPRVAGTRDAQLPPWPKDEPKDEPVLARQADSLVRTSGSATAAPQPADRKRAPLPRRRRQEHLAPGLQVDGQAARSVGTPQAPRHLRSPDDARNSMASFQRGTRQGRGTSEARNR
jgi:signal transduction histidine kinase